MKSSNLTATNADEMLTILKGKDYKTAIKFHELGKKMDLKTESRTGAHYYRIQYSTKKPKRSIYTIECNEKRWRVKASLQNVTKYIDKILKCSDILKDCMKATRPCTLCNDKCVHGVSFEIDDVNYFSCIGSGHFFSDLSISDWDDLIALLEKEINSMNLFSS